jgi:WD40 repeat protein
MSSAFDDLRSLPADKVAAVVDAFVLHVTQDGAWDVARSALAEFDGLPARRASLPARVGLAALRASLAGAGGDPMRAAPLWAEVGRVAGTHPAPEMRTIYRIRARLMRIAGGSAQSLKLRSCLHAIDALLSPRETEPVRRGHGDYVAELALTDVDGRRTLLSASGDGTVRSWDVQVAANSSVPLACPAGGTRTLSVAKLDGSLIAVVGADDGAVHVWDLGSSKPVREPLPVHDGPVRAVATVVVEGRLIAVSSGRDGIIRAYDVLTGAPAGPAREGPPESAGPVSIATLDGRLVVVAGRQDGIRGTLHAWDLRSGAALFTPPTPQPFGIVWAISTLCEGDRALAAFTTMGATVSVWDLRTGQQVGRKASHPGLGLSAVALTRWNGRLVALTGGGTENGQVRMTDVATGMPIGRPTHGEHQMIHGLVTYEEPDGLHVLSGGSDHAIRGWTFRPGTLAPAQALLGALFAAITARLDAAETGGVRRRPSPCGLNRLVTVAGAVGGPPGLAYARVLAARASWLAGDLGEQERFDDGVFNDAVAADGPLPALVAAGWRAPAHVGDHLCFEHLRMRPDTHPTPDAAAAQALRARNRLHDPDADRLTALLVRRETGARAGSPERLQPIIEALPDGPPPIECTAGHNAVEPLRVELAYAGLAAGDLDLADAVLRVPGAPVGHKSRLHRAQQRIDRVARRPADPAAVLTPHERWRQQELAGTAPGVRRDALLRLLDAEADAPTTSARLRSVAMRVSPDHSFDDVSLAFDLVEAASLTDASIPGLPEAVEQFSAWQWWRAHPSRLEEAVRLALHQAVLADTGEPFRVGWVRRLVPPRRLAELLLEAAEGLQNRLPAWSLPLAVNALDMFERTGDHCGAFRSGVLVSLLTTSTGGTVDTLLLRRLYQAFTAVAPDLPDWEEIVTAAADGDDGALPRHRLWGGWLLRLVAVLQLADPPEPAADTPFEVARAFRDAADRPMRIRGHHADIVQPQRRPWWFAPALMAVGTVSVAALVGLFWPVTAWALVVLGGGAAGALGLFRAGSRGPVAGLRIDALGPESLAPHAEPMPFDAVPRRAGLRITTTTRARWRRPLRHTENVIVDEPGIPPVWPGDQAPDSVATLHKWPDTIPLRVDESVDGLPWEITLTVRLGIRPRVWRESPVPGTRSSTPRSWSGLLYAPAPWADHLPSWFGPLPLTLPADTDPESIGATPLLVIVATATGVDERPRLLVRPQTAPGPTAPAMAIDPRHLQPNRRALIIVAGEPTPSRRWDARRRRDAFALRMCAADIMAAGAQAVWFLPSMPPAYGETAAREFAHCLAAGADPREAGFAAQAALDARLRTVTGWADLPGELTAFSRPA